jgi:hypothetical protein
MNDVISRKTGLIGMALAAGMSAMITAYSLMGSKAEQTQRAETAAAQQREVDASFYQNAHQSFIKRLPNYDSTRAALYVGNFEGSYEEELLQNLKEYYCK